MKAQLKTKVDITSLFAILEDIIAQNQSAQESHDSTLPVAPPACLSSFEYHYLLPLGSFILAKIPRNRCTSYASSHNDNISFQWQLLCRSVA